LQGYRIARNHREGKFSGRPHSQSSNRRQSPHLFARGCGHFYRFLFLNLYRRDKLIGPKLYLREDNLKCAFSQSWRRIDLGCREPFQRSQPFPPPSQMPVQAGIRATFFSDLPLLSVF
jgi:hypothetical protein